LQNQDLYGAPFLLYFIAKRNWKAVAGILVASALAVVTAIELFGWGDVHFYATQILRLERPKFLLPIKKRTRP
jgi:hypothetical protein